MTKEQYGAVISIVKRLGELNYVQEELKGTTKYKLTYIYKRPDEEDGICRSWVISAINDILDRHDIMIRQEIQDTIDQLKKQIEEL